MRGGWLSWRWFPVICIFCFLGACSPVDKKNQAGIQGERGVWLVAPYQGTESGRKAFSLLRNMYPDSRCLSVDQWEQISEGALTEGQVLILPDASRFPLPFWAALERFVEKGGRLLAMGRNPFAEKVSIHNGQACSEREGLLSRLQTAQPVPGLSSIQLWRHMNESGVMRGAVRPARSEKWPWTAVDVYVEDFLDWDTLSLPDVPGAKMAEAGNGLAVYLRGDEVTTRLAIMCEEKDGSVWSCTIAVSPHWQPHVLRVSDFNYFRGGKKRGGSGDHLHFSSIDRIEVGLSMRLAPQSPGEHRFGVSDFRILDDAGLASDIHDGPDLLALSPSFRRYETEVSEIHKLDAGDSYYLPDLVVQSPFPRSHGQGGRHAAPYRWIPLYEARDQNGETRGWPARSRRPGEAG